MANPGTPSGTQTFPLPFVGWLRTLYTWVQSKFGVVFVTSAYTVLENVYYVSCNSTGGAFTVTLPSATGRSGREIIIKRMNAGANAVTIGATIDGAVNPTLAAQYAYKRVFCDGSVWNDVT